MSNQKGSEAEAEATIKCILFIDLAFSSRLMAEHQLETIKFLTSCLAQFEEIGRRYGGRLVKKTGDGALFSFDTPSSAIEFAIEAQNRVAAMETLLGNLAAYRIGIHVGEVIQYDDDIYGNAVNTAARIEALADPGGICVSEQVSAMVGSGNGIEFFALGRKQLKNIPQGTSAFRVVVPAQFDHVIEQPAVYKIETLDGIRITCNGEETKIPRGKVRGLLGCLATAPQATETIRTISSILWPERQPEFGSRQIWKLLASLNVPIERNSIKLRLKLADFDIDLHGFEHDIKRGRIPLRVCRDGQWADSILAGLEKISTSYSSWLAVTRNEWRVRIASALESGLDGFNPADEACRDASTALLAMEPAHERAARALMRHYHAMENPGAANRVFERLNIQMRNTIGAAPKPETIAAAEGLDPEGFGKAVYGRAPLRIQLGAFEADTKEGNDLTSELRNELISSLASFRGWSVVEFEQPKHVQQKFSDYRLTGFHRNETKAITMTLSEPVSGRTVWSDIYEYKREKVHSTKQAIVARIAATLEVYISNDRDGFSNKTKSSEVVDNWLQAERVFFRWTPESHDEAIETYSHIIQLEPDFAPAYASLAGAYNVRHIVRPGLARDAVDSHRSYQLARRAVDLDPLDARNQLALAWSASLADEFDKANMHMGMAARLNPNSPRTIISCALGFSFFGDHERANELLAHSLECAPVLAGHQWCYAASVYYLSGNYTAALSAGLNGRDSIIDNSGWLAATYERLGRRREAVEQFKFLVQSVSQNWHADEPAAPAQILDWFANIYPIRNQIERDNLREALVEIL